MRPSTIAEEDGYLGPHDRVLEVGDEQAMVFTHQDSGPFWLSKEKQEQSRKDHYTRISPFTKKLTIHELADKLGAKGHVCKGKRRKELLDLARLTDVETSKTVSTFIGSDFQ